MDPPCVSVICPTSSSRSHFHPQLYQCFIEQAYPEKQLVVVETGESPSDFFGAEFIECDKRVVYRFIFVEDETQKISIGDKRNLAVELATGGLIAHFDDDDIYSPAYLNVMVWLLLEHGADLLKLSSWFVFDLCSGLLGYCDTELESDTRDQQDVDESAFGYGFSYVYTREASLKHPFPDIDMCEDYAFACALRENGFSVCLWPDLDGICLRLQHEDNTSRVFADDQVPRDVLRSSLVAENSRLEDVLHQHPEVRTDSNIVPAKGSTNRSQLLDLALTVHERRSRELAFSQHCARSHATSQGPSAGVDLLENRRLFGDDVEGLRLLEALASRITRVLVVAADGAPAPDGEDSELHLPWGARIVDARRALAPLLSLSVCNTGDAAGIDDARRICFFDVERRLEDRQLVLCRPILHYALLDDAVG